MLRSTTVCICLAAFAAVVSAETRIGAAYDLDSGQLIYREVHRPPSHLENTAALTVDYLDAAGYPLGLKEVDFSASTWLPEFRTIVPSMGFSEGVQRDAAGLLVWYQSADQNRVEHRLEGANGEAPRVADAGFDRFIRDNWPALLAGTSVGLEFLVPSRGEFIAMKVRHTGTVSEHGVKGESFVLEPASFVLRLLVSPITVSYTREERALLRYTGISNLPGPRGENLGVDISFTEGSAEIARRSDP